MRATYEVDCKYLCGARPAEWMHEGAHSTLKEAEKDFARIAKELREEGVPVKMRIVQYSARTIKRYHYRGKEGV